MTGPIYTARGLAILERAQQLLLLAFPEVSEHLQDCILEFAPQLAGLTAEAARRVARSEYEKARRSNGASGLVTAPRNSDG